MQMWKPLLIIVPAGLMLGAIGGHYARPVMKQRAGDDPWQQTFGRRAQRDGAVARPDDRTVSYNAYYAGGPSYPPPAADDDRAIAGWQGPDFRNWPDYKPEPMPTIEQLEAEVARRDTALDRQAMADGETVAGETPPADADTRASGDAADVDPKPQTYGGQIAGHPQVVTMPRSSSPATTTPEPRTAGGKLPAIW